MDNLRGITADIADRNQQEERWLSPDATAWERPEELINVLFDDYGYESFIEAFTSIFNEQQRIAASQLLTEMNQLIDETPDWLDPAAVLADPRWHSIRARASEFGVAFKAWPDPWLTMAAAELLDRYTHQYAARNKRLAEGS